MTTNIDDILGQATNVESFSVLDAIQGTAYPTDDVTVYTDAASAYKIEVIEDQIAETKDEDAVNALDADRLELVDKIKASALTFTLHGFAPEIVKAINDSAKAKYDVEDTDFGPVAREVNFRYLAESIQSVTNVAGAVDTHHWSLEDVQALEGRIPAEEFAKLMSKMEAVVFAAFLFDSKVDADFS